MTIQKKAFSRGSARLSNIDDVRFANNSWEFSYRGFGKRALDVMLVLILSVIVVPVILICAFLVSLDGRSPFYRQRRVGKGGVEFEMWKLRSMVHNADSKLEAYLEKNPEARKEWDSTQKLKADPRITRIGKFMRKCSVDELPQFWNVLKGDMSLVGPRPMLPEQRSMYQGSAYFLLRPGISGYWQISDRNEAEFVSRVAHDTRYNEELCLTTDLWVLAKTAGPVFRGSGY